MKHSIIETKNIHNHFLKLDLHKVKVEQDDGTIQFLDRYLVNGSNAASVFVYDKKNNLALMVEQFRIGMVHEASADSLECPAGLIDAGETAQQAIVRELNEETGLNITEDMLSQVSDSAYFSVGNSSQRISVFTCECDLSNVKEGIYGHDKDEYIQTKLIPYSVLVERLKAHKIKHITQIAAIQHSLLKDIIF